MQKCGDDTIPKDMTGQPTIPRKVWYTITDSGTWGNTTPMETEGRVHRPERRQTTKQDTYYDA